MDPLPGSKNGYEMKKISYTHDAVIDYIIENPMAGHQEIADHFGYSKVWISRLICSDAFQARLAKKKDLILNTVAASVEERVRETTLKALDIIDDKLDATSDPKLAMQFLTLTAKAQGYGARQGPGVQVNNTWIVPMPQRAPSAAEWEKAYSDRPIIEGSKE